MAVAYIGMLFCMYSGLYWDEGRLKSMARSYFWKQFKVGFVLKESNGELLPKERIWVW